ncbi:MAG: Nif3-like dinuclear metal center hexameric protein [Candidatus Dormibacteraeota bacterium]|uniref:GTP cyclohydrolase 1 type 2 homolog n=1 Tax=Candidatus Amunia macphersoniae TaxID=3127014 RepID=A0A934KRQ3_9BACT|nr:Nif3-like dinuclear metal center hexameric protein [Candidatus Dormibacteraeota bacterium]
MKLQDILDWSAQLAGCEQVPADSQVYIEAPSDVRRVLFGIDISLAEIIWAQQSGFDAVIAHHPLGDRARTRLAEVVHRQVDQMAAEGVAREAAEMAVATRLDAVRHNIHMGNVNALVDGARLVGMPLCNMHLACDIITRNALIDTLRSMSADVTVGDAIEVVGETFPEYRRGHARPEAWVGSTSNRLGRWTVAIAGGINGGFPVFNEYFQAGVDTIFAMHIDEGELQKLRATAEEDDALVVTGHMTSDSIGINVVIRGLEERGIEVVRTGGVVAPS